MCTIYIGKYAHAAYQVLSNQAPQAPQASMASIADLQRLESQLNQIRQIQYMQSMTMMMPPWVTPNAPTPTPASAPTSNVMTSMPNMSLQQTAMQGQYGRQPHPLLNQAPSPMPMPMQMPMQMPMPMPMPYQAMSPFPYPFTPTNY